jgi:excinuclease ABC subunit A
VHEIDAVPPLALRQKHTIEAVIDRFKPRADIKQRLAESFETALKLGDGMAIVRPWTMPERAPLLFSSKYSCPVCDYALPELEPRLFSFNRRWAPARAATAWAWPSSSTRRAWSRIRSCRWRRRDARLGPPQRLLLPDDHLAGEALQLRRGPALAAAAGRDPRDRAARQRQGAINLLHRRAATSTSASTAFEGIIPNLERRYRETESRRCARNCPSTSASAPAPNAAARA